MPRGAWRLALAFVPAMAVAAVVSSCRVDPSNNENNHAKATPSSKVVPISVEAARQIDLKTEEVRQRDLAVTLHATGHIQPDIGKEVDVSARFLGRVHQVYVQPGEYVTKGKLLAEVASQEISDLEAEVLEARAKLNIALAQEERERQAYEENLQRPKSLIAARSIFQETAVQLELAESEFQRQEGLYKEKISSQKDYLAAKGNLAKAKAAHNQASMDLQREEGLYKNQALMKRDYQLAQAETARVRQHINTLEQRLEFLGMTTQMITEAMTSGKINGTLAIHAPVSGVIAQQNIAPGEVIETGKTMFTITDLADVVACADIAEADLPKVHLGSPVVVRTNSYPDEKFFGTVSYVSENVNPETRTIAIRARLRNPQRHLKKDMYAEIDIETKAVSMLAVPKSAIQERDGRKVVFVQSPGGYQEREVKTGTQTEDYFAVVSGLEEGDRVATQGSLLLKSELTYQN